MANEKRLIDANALLEKVQFRIEPQGIIGEIVRDMVEKTREIIMAEPTVDAVEVVHGRWVQRLLTGKHGSATCSECNTTWDAESNYCPNCGAKMDGDQNDST